jgi:hypothetical protein
MTFPPIEIEYLREGFLCHQIKVPQQLQHPLQVLTTAFSHAQITLIGKEVSYVFQACVEGHFDH